MTTIKLSKEMTDWLELADRMEALAPGMKLFSVSGEKALRLAVVNARSLVSTMITRQWKDLVASEGEILEVEDAMCETWRQCSIMLNQIFYRMRFVLGDVVPPDSYISADLAHDLDQVLELIDLGARVAPVQPKLVPGASPIRFRRAIATLMCGHAVQAPDGSKLDDLVICDVCSDPQHQDEPIYMSIVRFTSGGWDATNE